MAKKKGVARNSTKVILPKSSPFKPPIMKIPIVKPPPVMKPPPIVKPVVNNRSFTDLPYPYYKHIKTPAMLGMSDKGTFDALSNDITGLISYVELLVAGTGKASVTGKPLGDKYFISTGSKCTDTKTKQEVDRYIYINNVPEGNIPIISDFVGAKFGSARGLIPGALGNLNSLNPGKIMNAFSDGSNPDCQEITMETIDNNNVKSTETHYVTLTDIRNIDAKLINKTSNVSKQKEKFETMKISGDPLDQLYYICLVGFGIYIVSRLVNK